MSVLNRKILLLLGGLIIIIDFSKAGMVPIGNPNNAKPAPSVNRPTMGKPLSTPGITSPGAYRPDRPQQFGNTLQQKPLNNFASSQSSVGNSQTHMIFTQNSVNGTDPVLMVTSTENTVHENENSHSTPMEQAITSNAPSEISNHVFSEEHSYNPANSVQQQTTYVEQTSIEQTHVVIPGQEQLPVASVAIPGDDEIVPIFVQETLPVSQEPTFVAAVETNSNISYETSTNVINEVAPAPSQEHHASLPPPSLSTSEESHANAPISTSTNTQSSSGIISNNNVEDEHYFNLEEYLAQANMVFGPTMYNNPDGIEGGIGEESVGDASDASLESQPGGEEFLTGSAESSAPIEHLEISEDTELGTENTSDVQEPSHLEDLTQVVDNMDNEILAEHVVTDSVPDYIPEPLVDTQLPVAVQDTIPDDEIINAHNLVDHPVTYPEVPVEQMEHSQIAPSVENDVQHQSIANESSEQSLLSHPQESSDDISIGHLAAENEPEVTVVSYNDHPEIGGDANAQVEVESSPQVTFTPDHQNEENHSVGEGIPHDEPFDVEQYLAQAAMLLGSSTYQPYKQNGPNKHLSAKELYYSDRKNSHQDLTSKDTNSQANLANADQFYQDVSTEARMPEVLSNIPIVTNPASDAIQPSHMGPKPSAATSDFKPASPNDEMKLPETQMLPAVHSLSHATPPLISSNIQHDPFDEDALLVLSRPEGLSEADEENPSGMDTHILPQTLVEQEFPNAPAATQNVTEEQLTTEPAMLQATVEEEPLREPEGYQHADSEHSPEAGLERARPFRPGLFRPSIAGIAPVYTYSGGKLNTPVPGEDIKLTHGSISTTNSKNQNGTFSMLHEAGESPQNSMMSLLGSTSFNSFFNGSQTNFTLPNNPNTFVVTQSQSPKVPVVQLPPTPSHSLISTNLPSSTAAASASSSSTSSNPPPPGATLYQNYYYPEDSVKFSNYLPHSIFNDVRPVATINPTPAREESIISQLESDVKSFQDDSVLIPPGQSILDLLAQDRRKAAAKGTGSDKRATSASGKSLEKNVTDPEYLATSIDQEEEDKAKATISDCPESKTLPQIQENPIAPEPEAKRQDIPIHVAQLDLSLGEPKREQPLEEKIENLPQEKKVESLEKVPENEKNIVMPLQIEASLPPIKNYSSETRETQAEVPVPDTPKDSAKEAPPRSTPSAKQKDDAPPAAGPSGPTLPQPPPAPAAIALPQIPEAMSIPTFEQIAIPDPMIHSPIIPPDISDKLGVVSIPPIPTVGDSKASNSKGLASSGNPSKPKPPKNPNARPNKNNSQNTVAAAPQPVPVQESTFVANPQEFTDPTKQQGFISLQEQYVSEEHDSMYTSSEEQKVETESYSESEEFIVPEEAIPDVEVPEMDGESPNQEQLLNGEKALPSKHGRPFPSGFGPSGHNPPFASSQHGVPFQSSPASIPSKNNVPEKGCTCSGSNNSNNNKPNDNGSDKQSFSSNNNNSNKPNDNSNDKQSSSNNNKPNDNSGDKHSSTDSGGSKYNNQNSGTGGKNNVNDPNSGGKNNQNDNNSGGKNNSNDKHVGGKLPTPSKNNQPSKHNTAPAPAPTAAPIEVPEPEVEAPSNVKPPRPTKPKRPSRPSGGSKKPKPKPAVEKNSNKLKDVEIKDEDELQRLQQKQILKNETGVPVPQRPGRKPAKPAMNSTLANNSNTTTAAPVKQPTELISMISVFGWEIPVINWAYFTEVFQGFFVEKVRTGSREFTCDESETDATVLRSELDVDFLCGDEADYSRRDIRTLFDSNICNMFCNSNGFSGGTCMPQKSCLCYMSDKRDFGIKLDKLQDYNHGSHNSSEKLPSESDDGCQDCRCLKSCQNRGKYVGYCSKSCHCGVPWYSEDMKKVPSP